MLPSGTCELLTKHKAVCRVLGQVPSSLGVYLIERRSARLVQVLFNARQELSLFYLCKFILITAH
jgi:hypothetical protein